MILLLTEFNSGLCRLTGTVQLVKECSSSLRSTAGGCTAAYMPWQLLRLLQRPTPCVERGRRSARGSINVSVRVWLSLLQPPARLSPPSLHYSHIEHTLTMATAVEDYSRLSLPHEYGPKDKAPSLSCRVPSSSPTEEGGDPAPRASRSHSLATSTLC